MYEKLNMSTLRFRFPPSFLEQGVCVLLVFFQDAQVYNRFSKKTWYLLQANF